MCSHRFEANRALVCDRQDEHDETCPGGHTYTATGGGTDAEPATPD